LSPVFDYDSFELSNGNCESFSIKQINPNELTEIKAKKILSLPPLILDGNYYGIARSISNIYETNYSNNAVTSNETIQIDIQELEFEKELIYVISANREALFKYNINYSISLIVKQVKPIQVDTIFPSRVNNRGWNTLKLNGNFEPNILQVNILIINIYLYMLIKYLKKRFV